MRLIITFFFLGLFLNLSSSQFTGCTAELCKRCCAVTPRGCTSVMRQISNGKYITNYSACSLCSCEHESQGCGWLGYGFGKVECSTCDYTLMLNHYLDESIVVGCGRAPVPSHYLDYLESSPYGKESYARDF